MPFLLFQRIITAPDPDASATPPIDISGCGGLAFGFLSNVAKSSIMFSVIYTDGVGGVGNVIGATTPVTITADAEPGWTGKYLGRSTGVTQLPAQGKLAFFKCEAINPTTPAGATAPLVTWTVSVEPL
jgi:hypothetical protein